MTRLKALTDFLYENYPVKDVLRHGIILNPDGLILFVQVDDGVRHLSFQESELDNLDKFFKEILNLIPSQKRLKVKIG